MNDARGQAIAAAAAWFDEGGLLADLRRRVAFRTESQRREQPVDEAHIVEMRQPANRDTVLRVPKPALDVLTFKGIPDGNAVLTSPGLDRYRVS